MKSFIDRFSEKGQGNMSLNGLRTAIQDMQFKEVRAVKALSLELLMLLAVRTRPDSLTSDKALKIMSQLEKYLDVLDENDFQVEVGDLHPEIVAAAKEAVKSGLPKADAEAEPAEGTLG